MVLRRNRNFTEMVLERNDCRKCSGFTAAAWSQLTVGEA